MATETSESHRAGRTRKGQGHARSTGKLLHYLAFNSLSSDLPSGLGLGPGPGAASAATATGGPGRRRRDRADYGDMMMMMSPGGPLSVTPGF